MSRILLTGGAGFIGSHITFELLNSDYSVVCIDNGNNCYVDQDEHLPESLKRVQSLTGKKIDYYKIDIRNKPALDEIFKKHKIDCVVHTSGSKSIGESQKNPLKFYQNNVSATCALLEVMQANELFNCIISSSSNIYGNPKYLPLTEKSPIGNCTNPYGRSKYFVEEIIKDVCADKRWNIISLRYFNPIGAHKSGFIGDHSTGEFKNLLPLISQVALGRIQTVKICGNDWETADGTPVRDYVHVMDVAVGHILSLRKILDKKFQGCAAYNLSSGCGHSILDVIKAFETVCGRKISFEFCERRPGDIDKKYASGKLAEDELGWKANRGLFEMCEDAWRWQKMNPNGYEPETISQ